MKFDKSKNPKAASDTRQISNYAKLVQKNYPNVRLNNLYVYYVTFAGTRILTYQSDKKGNLSLIKSRLKK